jgi:hypothetical protein
MNRRNIRRSKIKSPVANKLRAKRSARVKPGKAREFRDLPFIAPELRWVDAVLRSFQEEAPPAWVPFPYQTMLKKHARKSRKPRRVLH